jgi:2-keto-4-pentenoate hydratase
MLTDPTITFGATNAIDPGRIADALVRARLDAVPLPTFPGPLPANLREAYACQDAGIQRWPDSVVGWKVGWIGAADQARVGEERLVGPVFARHLRMLDSQEAAVHDIAVYVGGFGAVEAEVAFRIGHDTPATKFDWTPAEAAEYVGAAYAAVELASSPLATINKLGPCVIIADFGNNAGLLIGPKLVDWSPERDLGYSARTEINGHTVGIGGAATLPGGPLGALAFALGRCARNGRPLRAGQFVTTGASTGIHDILPGETSRVLFDGVGALDLRAVARGPA